MALFSLTVLPPPPSCHTIRRFSPPPCVALAPCHRRHSFHPSNKALSHICRQPRASSLGSGPQSSDGEDPLRESKEFPEEENSSATSPVDSTTSNNDDNHDDATHISSVVSSGEMPSSTNRAFDSTSVHSGPPVIESDRQQADLRATLDILSRSLDVLSSTLIEISSAVKVLSTALGSTQIEGTTSSFFSSSSSSSSAAAAVYFRSPSELRDAREAEAREAMSGADPPEPWDTTKGIGGNRGAVDTIPPYIVEQNERAHKLAYKLQQNFIQAQIEGLGKPFEVAADEFVQGCMEAHASGIGLKELQLQLVLQDGSLTGAFAIRNQRWTDDSILSESSRIRSLWIRLVYSAIAMMDTAPSFDSADTENEDPIESFVRQVLKLEAEKGYNLERLKLEHSFKRPEVASGAVKAMRENQYIILLTLEKMKL